MEFSKIAQIFEKLEKTPKRLEKIFILKDFLEKNPKNSPNILDLIAGNYQREIDKKTIGISLKTILSVIAFLSGKSESFVEKKFNKSGDVGIIAEELLTDKKQSGFVTDELKIEDFYKALDMISKKSGTNKTKNKKEILAKLFMMAQTNLEYKFLARLSIDDLRIGVSEGVLKEACVNAYFPMIIGLHRFCNKCSYISFNTQKCFSCKNEFNENEELKYIENNYKIIEVGTPKDYLGLDEFIGKRNELETIKFMLRIDKNKAIIKTENPRQVYNLFLNLFEKKYNVVNNFSNVLYDLKENLANVLTCNIILGKPIKSMLGNRVSSIEESFEISELPALADFKYDGLRMQIHNDYGKVKLFSRNLDDITKQFPEVVEFVIANFSDISFVIDSECVGFDFEKEKFLPFQVLSKRIMTKDYNEVSHISVVIKAFDLMFLNRETLIDYPYSKRRDELENIFLNRDITQKLTFDIKKLKEENSVWNY